MKQNSVYLSQVTYCGGYSGDEPPLTIPNREVKLTSADGTAPPGGRVGRCRFSEARSRQLDRASFVVRQRPTGTPTPYDPPSPLKSLSVFAAANTRDRVGRLMPTSLRSTCLVSATSRIPRGARTQRGSVAALDKHVLFLVIIYKPMSYVNIPVEIRIGVFGESIM